MESAHQTAKDIEAINSKIDKLHSELEALHDMRDDLIRQLAKSPTNI